jgi:xanthine dehydrogenase accessory factor
MKMSERAAQLLLARTPFVHATVVRAQQPTSAHAGDEAILLSDGTIEGFVGGQCAQNSVRKAALGVLQAGESVLLRVLPDGDVHFPEAPGACVVVNPCLSGGALEIFLVPQVPPPLIQINGATPIADALADLCGSLGYAVGRDRASEATGSVDRASEATGSVDRASEATGSVDDSGDALASTTAVVIASHGGPEAELVRAALDADVGYIGLVASRIRGASVLAGLQLTEPELARVHTPVGLPIGAKTPAEIAVSIVAEVIAAIRVEGLSATGHPLRVPEQATDPVCGMTVVVGSSTPHLSSAGEHHWFCSTACLATFAAAQ